MVSDVMEGFIREKLFSVVRKAYILEGATGRAWALICLPTLPGDMDRAKAPRWERSCLISCYVADFAAFP